MAKVIVAAEASKWDAEELAYNRKYLTDRCDWATLDEINSVLGVEESVDPEVEEAEAPVEEEITKGTNESEDVPKKKAKSKSTSSKKKS